jgi:hypothetical protein
VTARSREVSYVVRHIERHVGGFVAPPIASWPAANRTGICLGRRTLSVS